MIFRMLDFLFPRLCVSCGRRLAATEKHLCCECLRGLPRTNYHLQLPNPLEQLFWGQIPIEKATGFFFYYGQNTRGVIHKLKYSNNPAVGEYLARVMTDEIRGSGFFDGVDVVVPVPLAMRRFLHRGYNQCEWVARGIGTELGLPVDTKVVRRVKDNPTQTRLEATERWGNVDGVFRLDEGWRVAGKHVLLVDDVITTGATTVTCAQEMMKAGNVRFSVLSLAVAGERMLEQPINPLV